MKASARTGICGRAVAVFAVAFLAAGCAPRKSMKALIQMIEAQEGYFKNDILPEFMAKNRVTVDVEHINNVDSIEYDLTVHKGTVGLVKVPFGKSWSLVQDGLIKPLNSFLTTEQLAQFRHDYLLTAFGERDGAQYYIPRKFETRILVYRKSMVAEAVEFWRSSRDSINADLVRYNKAGLPATYLLEDDPNQWDFYDVFVAGWIWAHRTYGGIRGGKIAHRGRRYSGTSLRLVDRTFQCGGDTTMVLTMEGDPVVDAFHWEALYAAAGVYNPKMWEQSWAGGGIWEGFKNNEVFLAFMTQLDCFFIHGTGRDGLEGYLDDPDDMGVAVMPRGCSVELDNNREVSRKGCNAVTTGGWWWGIPASTPDPASSYALAMHITGTKNQIQECNRFGMIPVRKEILSDVNMLFGGGWITNIYEVSFQQLMHNNHTIVPTNPNYDAISNLYLDAWYDIVVGRNWSADKTVPDRAYIKNVLASSYHPRAMSLLRR